MSAAIRHPVDAATTAPAAARERQGLSLTLDAPIETSGPPGHPVLDARATPLRVGDRVRVVGAPDLSTLPEVGRAETSAVFAHIRGRCKTIAGFDDHGLVELAFRIRSGPQAGMHWVMIEPALLVRVRAAVV